MSVIFNWFPCRRISGKVGYISLLIHFTLFTLPSLKCSCGARWTPWASMLTFDHPSNSQVIKVEQKRNTKEISVSFLHTWSDYPCENLSYIYGILPCLHLRDGCKFVFIAVLTDVSSDKFSQQKKRKHQHLWNSSNHICSIIHFCAVKKSALECISLNYLGNYLQRIIVWYYGRVWDWNRISMRMQIE